MSQLRNSPTFFVCSYLDPSAYRSETGGWDTIHRGTGGVSVFSVFSVDSVAIF